MSAEALERLQGELAFLPRSRYDELPGDHVAFDHLNGGRKTEASLTQLIEADEGLIFVVGPSGSGKSSLIAATAGALTEDKYAPIRVRVAALEPAATDPLEMTRHMLREVHAHANGNHLTRAQRRRIEETVVDKKTRRGATSRFDAGLRAHGLPGLTGDLRLSLAGTSLDEEYGENLTTASEGVRALRGMFEHHGRVPVLIMEDTDAWLRGTGGGDPLDEDIADAFFTRNIARVAREYELTLLVAAHESYRDTAGYKRAREVMAGEIEVPAFHRPQEAIRAIFQNRIDRTGVAVTVDDVFEADALVRLEAEYDKNRSIRHVLRITQQALELAGPPFPERLAAGHVRAAAIG